MSRRPSVDLSIDGAIGVVTINRPDAMNAISGTVADELGDAFREIASRSDIWVMMLCAAGDRAFCVGADLKERASFTREDFYANRRQIRGMFKALRAVPQPTIAAVFGFALGGGFELALTCDLIVAAEGTVLGLPEVRVGLMPAGGGTQLLPRLIGSGRAKDLIFSGRRFDATEGREMGLVTRIVPRTKLDEAALEIARDICRSSPVAVREAKRAANAAFDVPIEEGIEVEHSGWEHVIESEDRHEGIAAFNEKRDPRWQNR
jgi:enoyl-CoA hydratase/carnithine racemase